MAELAGGTPDEPASARDHEVEREGGGAPETRRRSAADRESFRGGGRRTDTSDPQRSRERALKILFQADVRGADPAHTLAAMEDDEHARTMLDAVDDLTSDGGPEQRPPEAPGRSAEPIDGFTRSLVMGVADHRAGIDELISRYARRWQISRMPVVDRTVLRLATYELLHEPTPAAVVIDQAVGLAKGLSTDDSGRYVNGVLESIRKDLAARASTAPTVESAGVGAQDADADDLADEDEDVDSADGLRTGGEQDDGGDTLGGSDDPGRRDADPS